MVKPTFSITPSKLVLGDYTFKRDNGQTLVYNSGLIIHVYGDGSMRVTGTTKLAETLSPGRQKESLLTLHAHVGRALSVKQQLRQALLGEIMVYYCEGIRVGRQASVVRALIKRLGITETKTTDLASARPRRLVTSAVKSATKAVAVKPNTNDAVKPLVSGDAGKVTAKASAAVGKTTRAGAKALNKRSSSALTAGINAAVGKTVRAGTKAPAKSLNIKLGAGALAKKSA